jgi:hypothetical protein
MTTLTSTGAVNLTSSTNWSPAQTPVDGDDLVIGAHTLTLDADLRLDSITLNNGSSRFAISGTSRSVESTNGFIVAVSLSANLITAAIPSGTSLTLTGQWRSSANTNLLIASSTGGNLTLRTVGSNSSAILFDDAFLTTGSRIITSSWTGGTLTTIGRFSLAAWTGNSSIVTITGGTWSHQSVGMNSFGLGGHRIFFCSGTAVINWTGSIDSQSNISAAGLFTLSSNGTHTIGQSGDACCLRNSISGVAITSVVNITAGAVTLTGIFSARTHGYVIQQSGGTITYTNQVHTLPSTDYFAVTGTSGAMNISGLKITTAKGAFIQTYLTHTVTSNADTLFTCSTTAAFFGAYFNTSLESRFVVLASTPPTLPAVEDVAAGESYGYTASPLTGTGLILDPAVLAAAFGTALESISATALRRFVTIDTGETTAAAGSVASFGGSGGGESAEDIYTYFTTDSRQNAFKATGFSTPEDVSPTINFSPTINPTELSAGSLEDIWTYADRSLTEVVELDSSVLTKLDSIENGVDANTGYLTELLSRITANAAAAIQNLWHMIIGSGSSSKFTEAALENAPAGGSGGGEGGLTTEQAEQLSAIHEAIFPDDPDDTPVVIAPGPIGTITGWSICLGVDGAPQSGVVCQCRLQMSANLDFGKWHDGVTKLTATSNDAGVVQFQGLIAGCTYVFSRGGAGDVTFTVPADHEDTTITLPSFRNRSF